MFEQQFNNFNEWITYAPRVLTDHPSYNGTTFKAICYDRVGRLCTIGEHFIRAKDEDTFPIRWIWPDQVAQLEAARQAVGVEARSTLVAETILAAFENDPVISQTLGLYMAPLAKMLQGVMRLPSTTVDVRPLMWTYWDLPTKNGARGSYSANLPWGGSATIDNMVPDPDAPKLEWWCDYLCAPFETIDDAKAAVQQRVADHIRYGTQRTLATETILYAIQTKLRERGEDTDVAIHMFDNKSGGNAVFTVEACNPSSAVVLGESTGRYTLQRTSLDAALVELLDRVTTGQKT